MEIINPLSSDVTFAGLCGFDRLNPSNPCYTPAAVINQGIVLITLNERPLNE
jgi:hypothetical protein